MWQTSSTPPADRNVLIGLWRDKAAELERTKAQELELRQMVLTMCFPTPAEGTNNYPLGDGWQLKAIFKNNYTLANKEGQTGKALSDMANLGEEGKLIAGRLVRWKPDLSLSEYKKLPAACLALITPVLTIKPGTPSLELDPPKGV